MDRERCCAPGRKADRGPHFTWAAQEPGVWKFRRSAAALGVARGFCLGVGQGVLVIGRTVLTCHPLVPLVRRIASCKPLS